MHLSSTYALHSLLNKPPSTPSTNSVSRSSAATIWISWWKMLADTLETRTRTTECSSPLPAKYWLRFFYYLSKSNNYLIRTDHTAHWVSANQEEILTKSRKCVLLELLCFDGTLRSSTLYLPYMCISYSVILLPVKEHRMFCSKVRNFNFV
jgi:hypothetical protein